MTEESSQLIIFSYLWFVLTLDRTTERVNSVTRWLYCFFNICPFLTMKIRIIALKNVHIGFSVLPNNKCTLKQLPKTFKMLPTWWKFVKSGHTASEWQRNKSADSHTHPPTFLSICGKTFRKFWQFQRRSWSHNILCFGKTNLLNSLDST